MGRWAEYFEELLNVMDNREALVVAVGDGRRMPVMGEENDREIKREEIEKALKEMRTGKAPGLVGCHVECLFKGGGAMVDWLIRLLNVYFREGRVPSDWRSAWKNRIGS